MKRSRRRMVYENSTSEIQTSDARGELDAEDSSRKQGSGWEKKESEEDNGSSCADSADTEAWRRLRQRITGTALDQIVSHTVGCGWIERKYRFSDITLVILGERFNLHRMILSRSQYFEGLFSGGWIESESKEVELQMDNPYITVESLNVVLGYIYGATPVITSENAKGVLAAGSFFEIQDIVECATDFIRQDINAETFLEYEQFAAYGDYGTSSEKIKSSCWALVCFLGVEHLKESIAKLPLDRLVNIFTADAVWFSREYDRFRLMRETFELWESNQLKPRLNEAIKSIVYELADKVCAPAEVGADHDLSDHSESSVIPDEDSCEYDMTAAAAMEEYESLEREEFEAIVYIVSHKINFWDMSFKEQARIKKQLLREHLPVEAVISGPWIQDWLRDKISNPYLDLGLDDPRSPEEDVEDEATLKKIQARVARRASRGFSFTRLLSEVEAPVCRFGIEYSLKLILSLEVGGSLHSREHFYAGSLWKIFVQLYQDDKNGGQLMLGMFLHRRKADFGRERFVDERERVALRFQFTFPCQRGLMELGTVACDSKETYMPPSPKGWGWRSALSREEIAADEFMASIKCLRIIASLRIVL